MMTTTEDIIDGLVTVHMGAAPQSYRDDFRQALEVLVKLAKIEERAEVEADGLARRLH